MMPTLSDLPPERAGMRHADHYFRFASIVDNKYSFHPSPPSSHPPRPPWTAARWIRDYGGFLTSVLKTNRSSLLQVSQRRLGDTKSIGLGDGLQSLRVQAAATFEAPIDSPSGRPIMLHLVRLSVIPKFYEKYVRIEDPEDIPGKLFRWLRRQKNPDVHGQPPDGCVLCRADAIAARLEKAVHGYARSAMLRLLDGRLAHLSRLDTHLIIDYILDEAEVPEIHKQLLLRVMSVLQHLVLERFFSQLFIPVDWRRNYSLFYKMS